MIESQSRFINAIIGAVLDAKKIGKSLALKPKQKRLGEYNKQIQEVLKTTNFADERCNSWYKTKEGNITNNWSGTVRTISIFATGLLQSAEFGEQVVDYQKMMSTVHWDDFDMEGSGTGVLCGKKERYVGRAVEEPQYNAATVAAVVGATSLLVAMGTVVGVALFGSRSLRIR
jgi:hypothetical protein